MVAGGKCGALPALGLWLQMRDQRNRTIFSYQRVTNMNDADGGNGSVHQPAGWTFLTNHAHFFSASPTIRRCACATWPLRVGITERAVQRIVTDLEEGGYLAISKEGRRNRYRERGLSCATSSSGTARCRG